MVATARQGMGRAKRATERDRRIAATLDQVIRGGCRAMTGNARHLRRSANTGIGRRCTDRSEAVRWSR